ncbi:hypothetical protein HER10_EVM0000051 [Colletotrichum scovillei]|uniref:uncharacterized protein n=1 Tax=Colletotrichum scovillei TaxID=1209932 RepID=UPI0015C2F885|nr:uncharacterized protein HER10_EVM0000051 [Colletotrichum scovillei]KAF4783767.1 hypothetical protein HER10_EVM0000051 [Colletotrichum scovillei]
MPSSSPERHLVAPDNSNIASRQASQDSDREVKYQTGLMPAEYAGLEVASPSPGMKYYQPASGAAPEPVPAPAPGGYAPSENKTYTVPNSNLRFVRECGNNYPMNDLGHIPLTRMEDCMNLCAALAVTTQSADGPCVGVAWVTAGKQGTDENYCWLKSAKGAPDPKANIEAAWLVRT